MLFVILCIASHAHAEHLVVGTAPVAPFIIKNPDGSWSGISIDLWKAIAEKRGYDYEIQELAPKDLDDPAKLAAIDVFVSMNVTAKRAAQWELTHAFYSTGLAIAIAPKSDDGFAGILRQLFTARFGKLLLVLAAVLVGVGALMWLAERGRNDQFAGKAAHGIGAGMWWSAVTMTTVGYGDKAPVTFAGRVLGLVWMFAALLVVASFTGSISSALTVSQIGSGIAGPEDLPKARVGTVEPSSGAAYLKQRHIAYRGYPDAAAAVSGLARREVDAVVYEAPILQYRVKAEPSVRVLEGTFANHGYALGLRRGGVHRDEIDRTLLEIVESDAWQQVLGRYL
ncbi:MAG TPA: transporter substrate-binding domain-containing protein [Kofleriaceae bacterium]